MIYLVNQHTSPFSLGRPCQRCIKRRIGHLCHDETKPINHPLPLYSNIQPLSRLEYSGTLPNAPISFMSQQMNEEFTVINDFLRLNESTQQLYNEPHFNIPLNQTEKYILTAADPHDGSSEDKLREVLHAKYQAGLLRPYNYVYGYSRLQKYLESNMSPQNRHRILNALSIFRPAFREVAKSLTDIDLLLVEEQFERLLLDYDRVFSSMGIPSCLWRRTGEIYKANQEFSSLVNIPRDRFQDGKICIYELFSEESAVNYWQKYGDIAFDPGQKAVLTSCSLKYHQLDGSSLPEISRIRLSFIVPSPTSSSGSDPVSVHSITCCFSFTIRRDKYNIPSAIVGNFLPL